MSERYKEPTTKELINHLDRYESSSIIKQAITGESSFVNQVEEFYGLPKIGETLVRVAVAPSFGFVESQREDEEVPEDLIEILKPFSFKFKENWLDRLMKRADEVLLRSSSDDPTMQYGAVRRSSQRGPFSKGSDYTEIRAFHSLRSLGYFADSFVDETYRKHYFKKNPI